MIELPVLAQPGPAAERLHQVEQSLAHGCFTAKAGVLAGESPLLETRPRFSPSSRT